MRERQERVQHAMSFIRELSPLGTNMVAGLVRRSREVSSLAVYGEWPRVDNPLNGPAATSADAAVLVVLDWLKDRATDNCCGASIPLCFIEELADLIEHGINHSSSDYSARPD